MASEPRVPLSCFSAIFMAASMSLRVRGARQHPACIPAKDRGVKRGPHAYLKGTNRKLTLTLTRVSVRTQACGHASSEEGLEMRGNAPNQCSLDRMYTARIKTCTVL